MKTITETKAKLDISIIHTLQIHDKLNDPEIKLRSIADTTRVSSGSMFIIINYILGMR